MKKNIFILLSLINFIFTQVSIESTPRSLLLDNNLVPEEIILPQINLEQLMEEDRLERKSGITKPYRFAKTIEVDLNMTNSGTWSILEDGSAIWQLKIRSANAYSLNLIYDIFNIPPGAELFLFSENYETILGAFTDFNHKPHGGFSTAPIKGDVVILEYNEPANSIFNGEISISSVSHDYKNIFSKNSSRGYGDSGSCNNNVNCPEGDDWQDQISSVAMILTSGGSRLCTGSMVNNTAQDLTPYFLTANHCLGGNNSWIFMFNYESSGCQNQNGPTNMTVSGSTLLTNSATSDFALLELNESIPEDYNVFFSGWDVTGNTPNTPVCIHHPSGDIKKITFDEDNASNAGSYWDVNNWEDGTTEPGSSGSPLFDGNSKRIVGQLYGGSASCTSITYDTYGKTSVSWNSGMSAYLDPINSGAQILDGTSTGGGITISHDDLNDMPYNNDSINFSATVTSNGSNIENIELYYNLGDNWRNQEMTGSFSNNYTASINGLYDGMIIKYYIQAVNSEGEIQTYPNDAPNNTILFILGDLPDLYTNNFESNTSDWIIGDDDDTATAGIWELAEPTATYNDDNIQIQPGADSDDQGTFCFITGNGFQGTNGGFDDVDGGKTTLYSPEFNINELDEVIVTYWRWYTNNIGDNGNNDKWIVSITNNGINWVDLENTTSSNTSWEKKRFILSDYINLESTIQLRFIAEDIFYNGDDGSGGSLVEAAIDNFSIQYISENSNILGDLNNDNEVNVSDVVLLVNMILGSIETNSAADINNDNNINVGDVVSLVNLILQ
ncbi:MAG: hypothetical protein CMG64_01170 [Candidatus Marinimicrobia bacterium]|nr:hypothetical protein [Candidatus Neomarinimicrobiota bacterium]|tara:strand:- start:4311 stop:6662 length:2352 start_codon:yes stop_codon:yes gene_type:complete